MTPGRYYTSITSQSITTLKREPIGTAVSGLHQKSARNIGSTKQAISNLKRQIFQYSVKEMNIFSFYRYSYLLSDKWINTGLLNRLVKLFPYARGNG